MNSFSFIKKVSQNDLDDLNHVNNVVYVAWIQEISKRHWEEVSHKSTINYIWVVRRHDITYLGSAKLNDEILITTRIQNTKGPISFRVVEMKDNKTGIILVKSITEWCLLNSESFKPIRVPETIKNLFQES